MAKPSWHKLRVEGDDGSLQQIWSALAKTSASGSIDDLRVLQFFAASPASGAAARARQSDWIAVALPEQPVSGERTSISTAASIPDLAALAAWAPSQAIEGAAVREFTLQVGLPAPARNIVPPAMIVDSEARATPSVVTDDILAQFLLAYIEPQFPQATFDDQSLGAGALDGGHLLLGLPDGLDPRFDTLTLSGDFSAGYILSNLPSRVVQIAVAAGNDYVLAVDDDLVAPGGWLLVHADTLGTGNHLTFDGSAETDGRFDVFGGRGGDTITGGARDDFIRGLGGADTLTGGGGADDFVYMSARDSTGVNYDTITDFDAAADKIDLPFKMRVAGFGAAVTSGALSTGSFDGDLASALSGLAPNQARWFTPTTGDLAGTIFLVVDGNGIAGYQSGEDFVLAIGGSSLATLSAQPDIFV